MTCGKICAGKSTYAENLRRKYKAAVLSVDEITLALFGQNAGEKHDYYVEKAEEYLFGKSLQMIENDIDVILDWGFWTKAERQAARQFYESRNIENEFHYIDIDDDEWKKRLSKRNSEILANKTNAYFVDDGLAEKADSLFEKPDISEVEVWVGNEKREIRYAKETDRKFWYSLDRHLSDNEFTRKIAAKQCYTRKRKD